MSRYDGTVTLDVMLIRELYCSLDLRLMPFDTQVCTLQFINWSFDLLEVDLRLAKDPVYQVRAPSAGRSSARRSRAWQRGSFASAVPGGC